MATPKVVAKRANLLPTDAPRPEVDEPLLRQKALSTHQIETWAREMDAKETLFLFDSCLAGEIFQSRTLRDMRPARRSSTRARQFIASCSAGQELPSSSLLVTSLIRALDGSADSNNDGNLTGRELADYISRLIRFDEGQTPQYGALNDPHFGGDFVFRLPNRRAERGGGEEDGVLPKVVGLTDNIAIRDTPQGSRILGRMETLRPYFIIGEEGGFYRISTRQESGEGDIRWYVPKREVTRWDTREGLRFKVDTFEMDRRDSVEAWDSEERIRLFAETGDAALYGPTFGEDLLNRIGTREIVPYPLLDTRVIETASGEKMRIHQVLIPVFIPATAEMDLDPPEIESVVGAVTFCVVFDATRSMQK